MRPSGGRRVAAILAAYVLVLALTAAAVVPRTWDKGRGAGWHDRPYISIMGRADPSRGPLDLAWLGDSTSFSGLRTDTSYADTMIRNLSAASNIRAANFAWPGLDFFAFYPLVAGLLGREPRVVVLVLNFRLFGLTGIAPYDDLLALVPLEETPRLLALPFALRGATAARFLVWRLLRWEWARETMLYAQGIRRLARGDPPAATPPALAARGAKAGMLRQALHDLCREYARPIHDEDPVVRLVGATVDLVTRHGARALVIVTPVPVQALRRCGVYETADYARRIAVVERAVRANGGELLDLHAALQRSDLRDASGHFTRRGQDRMLQVTTPVVLNELFTSGWKPGPPGG